MKKERKSMHERARRLIPFVPYNNPGICTRPGSGIRIVFVAGNMTQILSTLFPGPFGKDTRGQPH